MNAVKTQGLSAATESAAPQVSGKIIIGSVLFVAIAGALFSWFFRYNATHRSAKFWGSEAARLIRDAPVVEFCRNNPNPDPAALSLPTKSFSQIHATVEPIDVRDESGAHGLAHLRTAILEDRSYVWPPQPYKAGTRWPWILNFRGNKENELVTLLFSLDCKYVTNFRHSDEILSCEP